MKNVDFRTMLFLLLSLALVVKNGLADLARTGEDCLCAPATSLTQSSFQWGGGNASLAQRTVYRNTGSWSGREVLLLDLAHDQPLRSFLTQLQTAVSGLPELESVQACFDMVREALGNEINGAQRELDYPLAKGGEVIHIGRYIQEQQGVCRHRNFLLKISLDAVGIHGASLMRGTVSSGQRHVWLQYNSTLIFDAMWYNGPVSNAQQLASSPGLRFDGSPVPLGRCGTTWPASDDVDASQPAQHCASNASQSGTTMRYREEAGARLQPTMPSWESKVKSMRVKQLQALLKENNRVCRGCIDKESLIEEALKIPPPTIHLMTLRHLTGVLETLDKAGASCSECEDRADVLNAVLEQLQGATLSKLKEVRLPTPLAWGWCRKKIAATS